MQAASLRIASSGSDEPTVVEGALASARADRWLAPRLSSRLAPRRPARGSGDGRGRDPPGDGVRGVAGLPVQAGPYCALVPMALYALLGTSRPLSVSTTSTISLLTATAIASAPKSSDPTEVASLLALEVGGILVVAGVLRLGFASDFISRPVLDRFKIGMALSIAASQLGKVLGVDVQGETFFPKVLSTLQQLGDINVPTLAMSVDVVVALVVIRRVAPGVPGPLLVLVGATLVMGLTTLEHVGSRPSPRSQPDCRRRTCRRSIWRGHFCRRLPASP
jgi:MFS superfamily sulfate permease-like transporter